MPLYAYIYRECPVKIWGLTSRQRIERVLKADGKSKMVNDLSALHDDDFVLILRADHLFDDRLVKYLAATPNIVLQLNGEPKKIAVAAHVPASIAHQALDVIEKTAMAESLPGVKTQTLETLSLSFQERIRKFEIPFVLSISAEKSRDLERRLFDWSYKGRHRFDHKVGLADSGPMDGRTMCSLWDPAEPCHPDRLVTGNTRRGVVRLRSLWLGSARRMVDDFFRHRGWKISASNRNIQPVWALF